MARNVMAVQHSKMAIREARWGFLFILPFFIFFAIFRIVPSILALVLSVVQWIPGTGETHFVGLQYFSTLFGMSQFWKAMFNTFYYAVLVTPTGLVLALITAALIHNLAAQRLREFFQGAFYLPTVLAAVSVTVLWRYIYDYEVGLFNQLLSLVGIDKILWLGDPAIAMISIALMEVMTGLGGTIIIFVAALAGIPNDYYDAAEIDGAQKTQVFFHITLPLLTPAILYVAVVRTIGAFQVFVPIYLMTQGGPANATLTVGFLIWRQVMVYAEIGLATALGLALLAATLVFTILQFHWFKQVVEY